MEDDPERDEKTGKFLPGNRFWLARSSAGPKPMFDGPEPLRLACCEYFDWAHKNPLYEDKIGFYEGKAEHEAMAKMRAMTIAGLCIFLDVSERQWRIWREERTDLIPVIEWAESVIKQQKFAGAAAGLLNANIIARDLGLADKSELQNLDKDGKPADPVGPNPYTAEALAAIEKAKQHAGSE